MSTCPRCGAPAAEAFPGVTYTCACGASRTIPHATREEGPAGGPYRAAAPPPAPPRGEEPAAGLPCPRCHGRLVPFGPPPAARARAAEGALCECHSCGGLFLDHGQLAEYVASARDGIVPLEDESVGADHPFVDAMYLPCPICGERMNRSNFGHKSGVLIDVCRAHGTWFDRGELHAALRFAASPAYDRALLDREAREAARRAESRQKLSKEVAAAALAAEDPRLRPLVGTSLTQEFFELLAWTLFR